MVVSRSREGDNEELLFNSMEFQFGKMKKLWRMKVLVAQQYECT